MTSKIKVDVPTVASRDESGWAILNSSLGCGTRVLQGWSEGIGLDEAGNKALFEQRFYKLLAWSAHLPLKVRDTDYTGNLKSKYQGYWNIASKGNTEAPIGIALCRHQFLNPNQTYTISSLVPWIDRFEKYVKDNDLGEFSRSHEWSNINYRQKPNVTALWTWNGRVPKKPEELANWEDPQ
jgi:hypothetical protein